jgi:hypothetical protein
MDLWDCRAGAVAIRSCSLRLLEGGQMVRTCWAALVAVVVLSASAAVWAQVDDAATNPGRDASAAATGDADATGDVDSADPDLVIDGDPDAGPTDADAMESPAAGSDAVDDNAADDDADDGVVEGAVEGTTETLEDVAERVDQSEQAQKISAGILNPIYTLAERLSFPYFHWLAFAAMVTGVVSFALQLVLGKLIVLSRMSLSPSEILADSLGLAISLVGLVLTTQAAAENSSFTASSFAVISSTAVGIIAGFIFYIWGQRQELLAVEGRRRVAEAERITAANKK